ncbi:hypothetical protein AOY36_13660 [Enterococcus faecium]|uniref:hypothetical protein n=1 Tax=Enterococcus faecium TaxID=1352 RepID=UPI00071B6042|nr:hypothetical protein [Enterococcus faecium]KST48202.1 hypothetical protein AOY36_13660 [Enterococcus faecium]
MNILNTLKNDDATLDAKVEQMIYSDSSYSNGEIIDSISEIVPQWNQAVVKNSTVTVPIFVAMKLGEETSDKTIYEANITVNVTFGNFSNGDYDITSMELIHTSF